MNTDRKPLSITTVLISLLVALLFAAPLFFYPIRALAWHLTHGNYVTFANTRANIPLLWSPTNDEGPYLLTVSRARVAQFPLIETIHIRRLKPDEITSDSSLRDTLDLIAERNNVRQNSPLGLFHVAEIHADNMSVYCLEARTDYITCRSPEMEWNISALPAFHPDEIQSILSSLHRLR